ncbi:hypothetical protein Tco_0599815 [Tanacetum coccineum]
MSGSKMVSSLPVERRYGGVMGYVRKARKIHTTNAREKIGHPRMIRLQELSKVLVSSKKELGKVEGDLITKSEDGKLINLLCFDLAIILWLTTISLNPLFTIKECSSCGSLYNKGYCCIPGSSQQPLRDCPKYGNPVEGPNCQGCALWRKKLKEVWFTICHENGIYQDLLNTYESSDDDTNVVNAPREPFVVKQVPGVNSSQSPPQIDHHCCYECGDSLNDIFCQRSFKEHSKTIVDSNDDSTLSNDNSPYCEDIDYVDASPPDAEIVSLEVVESVIPEVRGIDDDILLTIKDDILREKLLNVNLLIANIEALKDNPTPSSDFVIKSPSTFPNSFLEETNTFDNSLTESETFRFNLEEISSGSTTTHADFSQYDSFIFDLSINPFPPTDRSDFYHEEFADELAHIISPPEYDCFYFKNEPELGDFTMDVVGDIYPTREPRVHVPNVLPTHPTLDLDLDFILLSEPLFAYIVWIFLPFLTYPVAPPYLLSCGNEDTIFDPGISVYHSFMPGVSHRSGTFMKFIVYPNHLNGSPMEILSSTCSPMDQ